MLRAEAALVVVVRAEVEVDSVVAEEFQISLLAEALLVRPVPAG